MPLSSLTQHSQVTRTPATPAFPEEKIPTSDSQGSSPTTQTGTLPPAYSDGGVSTTIRSRNATSSQPISQVISTASKSDIAPDADPVTQQTLVSDADKEVYIAREDSTSNSASQSLSTVQQTRSYREYGFHYTNTLTHLIICDPNQSALYFAEMSPFVKGLPDVQLRDLTAGFDNLVSKGLGLSNTDAKAVPVVATADPIPESKHIRLGLGDPLEPERVQWVTMRNVHEDSSAKVSKYDMVVTVPGSKQVNFEWIVGAGAEDASGSSSRLGRGESHSKEAFRLLSEDGLVASFRNASFASVKKRGALRLYEVPNLNDMLPIIFLGAAALCEKQRRSKVKKAFGFRSK